jgi:hypothetical protein
LTGDSCRPGTDDIHAHTKPLKLGASPVRGKGSKRSRAEGTAHNGL